MINTYVSLESMSVKTSDLVYDLAVQQSSNPQETILYAAKMSGLYRSKNAGKTWQALYDTLNLDEALPTLAVCTVFDKHDQPIVFAGVAGGILRSSHGGEDWESVFRPSPPATITCFAPSPTFYNDGMIFAGTLKDGVYQSSDYGVTWQHSNFGLLDYSIFCIAISPNFLVDETLYIGTQSGIFESINAGQSWQEFDMPMGYEAILSLAISSNYVEDSILLVGTETQGLWQVHTQQTKWKPLAEKVINGAVDAILSTTISSGSSSMIVVRGGKLYVTPDHGISWNVHPAFTVTTQRITAICEVDRSSNFTTVIVGNSSGEITFTS